jgi:signal transduction histidine kinase/DNA-binding response OmpR family regulator
MGSRVRDALQEGTHPLLGDRLRGLCWIAVVAIPLSLVSDWSLPMPSRRLLIAVKLWGIALCVLGLLLPRRRHLGRWRPLVLTAIGVVTGILIVPTIGAIAHTDPQRGAFTIALIAMATGATFPWGAGAQAAVAAVAALDVAILVALHPGGVALATNTLVAVYALLGASVYVALVQDLQRRERAQADVLQEGQKRVLELVAQDAPLEEIFRALIASLEEREPGMVLAIRVLGGDGPPVLHLVSAPTLRPEIAAAFGEMPLGAEQITSIGGSVTSGDLGTDRSGNDRWHVARNAAFRRWRAEPVRGADGSLLGTVGAYSCDATEPSASQVELLELAASLAGIAIERARSREELVRARDAAESAARVKGEFVANMRHELRAPLNGVIGAAAILLETDLDGEQRDFANIIRTSGQTLIAIVDDILDFSKIEATRMALEEQPFELARCVTEAMDLVALRASERDIELIYSLEPDVPRWIVGDATRLRQILVNLLGNAVKFTEQGEVAVSATVLGLVGGRYELEIAVRDTGIGIPRDRLGSVFEPFTQGDASTTRQYGGTGLGLAISRRFVELMGGTLSVESEVGVGSTFRFTLQTRAGPAESAAPDGRATLPGRRLLIVDDNVTALRLLEREARSWGMVVHAVASGADALAWLDEGGRHDVALIDQRMPGMDGLTLARRPDEMEATRGVPRMLLGSLIPDDGEGARLDARRAFARVLPKPVHLDRLRLALTDLLAPRSASPVEHNPTGPAPGAIDSELGQRHPLRILVAKDNLINRRVATKMLKRMGYSAEVITNGLEAVAAVAGRPFDVVLMDMQMPEMDGVTASERIRASLPATAQPYLIAMTANVSQQDRELCMRAGMNDFLGKPVAAPDLAAALERVPPITRPAGGLDGSAGSARPS